MSPPVDGDMLPSEHQALRLPKPPRDFAPERYKPGAADFIPSSEDESSAKERARAVRVSVWDEALTSIDQAVELRGAPAMVLRFAVQDAICAGSAGPPIRVVYEPLDPPGRDRPGADGHAGVEGLDQPEGAGQQAKSARRRRRQAIADACVVVGLREPNTTP
ncbi:MAG: hypothetical protein KIT72_06385 [Polyangiaceae bacterium]|nr:hypothetical protein [Polyangiaceae bacterium]MCW5790029.1 hypothetical protein [Polyangiaceae bacterium]